MFDYACYAMIDDGWLTKHQLYSVAMFFSRCHFIVFLYYISSSLFSSCVFYFLLKFKSCCCKILGKSNEINCKFYLF